ncbi:DUF4907 domain-containing protein [Lutibacter sp.]|uniref:DUF4907 domain-containing protein n=1 Tax=Lutibacter sp. TaxID=1925666 RepID=UPI0025B81C82|nr:DUF4907 domain-containing protein [Lutibacter sp.]MCF6181711.1 DUF4907 domain-containing protein [Lutibacter sp.]
MKKKKIFLVILFIISLLFIGLNNGSTKSYHLKSYQLDNGWGYMILKKNKVIIKQEIIPAISIKKPFANKRDAEIVGELMIDKLKSKQIPSITYNELQTKKIIF